MIQRDYTLVKNDFEVIDGKKKLNKTVLLQTFNEFYKNNFTSDERHSIDKNVLSSALCFTAANKKVIWNIRIYETLGLDQNKLIHQDEMDENYLALYDKKLKEVGLSLDERLTKKDIEDLQKEDPDYLRKSEYIGRGR